MTRGVDKGIGRSVVIWRTAAVAIMAAEEPGLSRQDVCRGGLLGQGRRVRVGTCNGLQALTHKRASACTPCRLLMKKSVGLDDLAGVAPEVHASLGKLLGYPADVLEQLGLFFQVRPWLCSLLSHRTCMHLLQQVSFVYMAACMGRPPSWQQMPPPPLLVSIAQRIPMPPLPGNCMVPADRANSTNCSA